MKDDVRCSLCQVLPMPEAREANHTLISHQRSGNALVHALSTGIQRAESVPRQVRLCSDADPLQPPVSNSALQRG